MSPSVTLYPPQHLCVSTTSPDRSICLCIYLPTGLSRFVGLSINTQLSGSTCLSVSIYLPICQPGGMHIGQSAPQNFLVHSSAPCSLRNSSLRGVSNRRLVMDACVFSLTDACLDTYPARVSLHTCTYVCGRFCAVSFGERKGRQGGIRSHLEVERGAGAPVAPLLPPETKTEGGGAWTNFSEAKSLSRFFFPSPSGAFSFSFCSSMLSCLTGRRSEEESQTLSYCVVCFFFPTELQFQVYIHCMHARRTRLLYSRTYGVFRLSFFRVFSFSFIQCGNSETSQYFLPSLSLLRSLTTACVLKKSSFASSSPWSPPTGTLPASRSFLSVGLAFSSCQQPSQHTTRARLLDPGVCLFPFLLLAFVRRMRAEIDAPVLSESQPDESFFSASQRCVSRARRRRVEQPPRLLFLFFFFSSAPWCQAPLIFFAAFVASLRSSSCLVFACS